MAKKQDIIDEVREKVESFETHQSGEISQYNDWSDIFAIKKPTRSSSSKHYSNPRLSEMFRSVNALSTLELRMMTAQEPYFDISPVDLSIDPKGLSRIEAVIDAQMKACQHKRYLLKALISKVLFGTVFVENSYRNYSLNRFGRIMPATSFVPRSLIQVAFDRNATDLDEASWVNICDLKDRDFLRGLLRDDPNGDIWINSEMQQAIGDDTPMPNPNQFIVERMTRGGYTPDTDAEKKIRELAIYRGKLDTVNDGGEYVVGLVNRKYLVRFHPNNSQHGKRDFRVARWVEFEMEALALGLGKLLGPTHKSMDANRQKVQDGITFDTYSMWLVDRLANINAQDFKVKPMNIIESDGIHGMKRLDANVAGATLGLKLDEILRNEFQSASGATPTLQALVTEATASEVTLAQNEALRNVSVKAELAADSLVREHVEIQHADNIENINQPLSVNIKGKPGMVYPSDLWYDVDFKTKVVTDKDFKPQRLKSLVEVLQVLTSIRNEHPEKMQISVFPFVREIARSLGVNAEDLIKQISPEQQIMNILTQAQGQQGGDPNSQLPPVPGAQSQLPVTDTPGGMALTSP